MNRLAAIALAFAPVFVAQAQLPQHHAQVFGAEQGIGAGGIADIFKDRQQFLWIVNANSMQRFDGRNVRTYSFEKPIYQALCSRDNRIWAVAGRQLWRSRKGAEGFEPAPFDTSSNGHPMAVFQLSNRPVCVLSTEGIFAWREQQRQFERLPLSPPPPASSVNLWRFDTCGTTIFYPGTGCLYAFDLATGRARQLPVEKEIPFLYALTPSLVVLSNYNVHTYWYDFEAGTVNPIDPFSNGRAGRRRVFGITGVAPIGGGRYLMTSRIGTYMYDMNRGQFSRQPIFAAGKPVETEDLLMRVFLDENGTAWAHDVNNIIAFEKDGIGLLRNHHAEPPGYWSNRVVGFAEDGDGNLWFGGAGGFKKLNLRTGKVSPFPAVEGAAGWLSHPSVRGMAFDGRYLILGPTDKGVWLFDPRTEAFRRPVYASDSARTESERDFIDYLTVLRNGDILVCGRFHPYRISAKTYRLDFLHFPGDRSNTNTAMQDGLGRIWIGTQDGVYVLDEQYRFLGKYPARPVFCFFEESSQAILAGTAGGLLRIATGTFEAPVDTAFLPEDGLYFSSIFRDSLRRFWFGSSDGLILADAGLRVFKKFDFADNLQGKVFNAGSCYRAGNGLLFLGGVNGINYFYPEKIALEDRPLSVSLQAMWVNDRDTVAAWQPSGLLRLPHYENTLTFEVVAPYFNNAGKLQYRYRLLGRSGRWVSIGLGNQIRLASLPPGEYRLDVAASITGQAWYEGPGSLAIRVLPPFWQTWPFRLAMLLSILALIAGFVRWREKRLKKQQQARLELEKLRNTNLLYQLETEQVVNFFSQTIAADSTLEEALWNVAQQCIARLGWEDCVIYLLDAERGVLVQKAAWGWKSAPARQIVNPIEIPLGQGIVGAVAESGQPALIGDTSSDPRYIVDDAVRASELAVPILADGRVIGVIDSEHSQKNYFTAWHLQILSAIATLCSNKVRLVQAEEARQQALLQAVDNQRKAAEAKLQSMRLQMNPHFLFNALNSIQQMILSGNGDSAALYLSKFSKLLRMVLTNSGREYVSLREELDMLGLYLALESLRFDDTFTYSIHCEDGLDTEDYKAPPLLIQPFVENAIWHGLLHKEGRRLLRIRFETTADDRLACTIEDNGIGREAARAYARSRPHSGKGLSVGAERIEALNRQYGRQNTLKVEDLLTDDGRAAGTRVVLVLD